MKRRSKAPARKRVALKVGTIQAIWGELRNDRKKLTGQVMVAGQNHTQVFEFSVQNIKGGKSRIIIDHGFIKNPEIKTWKRDDKRPRRRVKRSK